jgi:pilus assembly protein CpaE
MADLFPARLVEVTGSGRAARAALPDVSPDVVLIAEGLDDVSPLDLGRETALSHPACGVVLLSRDESVGHYQDAMAAGARGVVTLTESPGGLTVQSLEALNRAVTQAYEFSHVGERKGASRPERAVIVLFSPKGGVGVTAISLNLAAASALLGPGRRVAYVDLHLQFGTSPLFFGDLGGPSVVDLAIASEELGRHTLETGVAKREIGANRSLYVVPAPSNPREGEIVSEAHVRAMLVAMRRVYDVIIVDTPTVVSDVTLAALQSGDQVLFVTTLDAMAVAEARVATRLLADPNLGIVSRRFGLVVNSIPEGGKAPIIRRQDLEGLLHLPVVGQVPHDADFVGARMAGGEFLVDEEWAHPVARAFKSLAESVVPAAVVREEGIPWQPRYAGKRAQG